MSTKMISRWGSQGHPFQTRHPTNSDLLSLRDRPVARPVNRINAICALRSAPSIQLAQFPRGSFSFGHLTIDHFIHPKPTKNNAMKYMLTWTERPQGSPIEYENAQKRILEVFTQWKAPANFKIELFVIRVGDWGGYMLLDCDDPTAVHKFCSLLPAFVFEARPVIPIADAVRVELESIAFRDGLKSK